MEAKTFADLKEEIIEMLEKVESYKGMDLLHCAVKSCIKIEQRKNEKEPCV